MCGPLPRRPQSAAPGSSRVARRRRFVSARTGSRLNALAGKVQADRVLTFLQREYPDAFGEARAELRPPGIRRTRRIADRAQIERSWRNQAQRPFCLRSQNPLK